MNYHPLGYHYKNLISSEETIVERQSINVLLHRIKQLEYFSVLKRIRYLFSRSFDKNFQSYS